MSGVRLVVQGVTQRYGRGAAATTVLRDVDTVDDARLVAAAAPHSHFAAAWTSFGK